MKWLWAPWRLKYILSDKKGSGCIFCLNPNAGDDRENLILYRGKLNFVILNLYPYNNGHLMVVPYRHIDDMNDLTPDENSEMMSLTQKSAKILKERFKPHGFNIGMNVGSVAGAGIEEHIHMHIVPRWNGDTNFMPVVGQTRVMPQQVGDTYDCLIESFRKL